MAGRKDGEEVTEEEAFQQDLEEQQQLALDCLTVCAKHGLEGTANTLAALMGLSRQFSQQKESFTRRVA
jgi:hypothetical protein